MNICESYFFENFKYARCIYLKKLKNATQKTIALKNALLVFI